MKGNTEQNVIDINAGLPQVEVLETPDTLGALNHYWNIDFAEIKALRHQLYLKVNQLSQYRHKPVHVQEAVYTMREAMITVNEAQCDIDRANKQ